MKTIKLATPKIEVYGDDKVKWSCDISGDFMNDSLYYVVEKKWGGCLTDNRLDAAVVALLPYIMYRSSEEDPIELICDAPLSEKLYFQLTTELIPALKKYCTWYKTFNIRCRTTTDVYDAKAVLTSVTGGVDSFYTLVKSKREFPENYKVTHAMFCGMADRDNVNSAEYNNAKEICKNMGLEFVYVESNVCGGVYESRHDAISSFAICSIPLVLGKLVKLYYHSSTYVYSDFKLDPEAISKADLLLCNSFCTEGLNFYTSSMAVTRAEKTAYISDDPVVQQHLLACGFTQVEDNHTRNCSICSKCTITMLDLDLSGNLRLYNKVFDVNRYRNNPLYYWGYLFYKEKHGCYIDSTLEMAKQKQFKIPFGARLMGLIKIIKHGFKRTNPYQHSFRP